MLSGTWITTDELYGVLIYFSCLADDATVFCCEAPEMFCGLWNFPWLSIYLHGGRKWWLNDFYFGCIFPLNPPLVQHTCTSPPPGSETSSSAGGRGSPGPGGGSAGPAPLSPPPGPPSAPAKNRKWKRKRKQFKKRYESLTARVNINTLCATVGHVQHVGQTSVSHICRGVLFLYQLNSDTTKLTLLLIDLHVSTLLVAGRPGPHWENAALSS